MCAGRDALWRHLRDEARAAMALEPALSGFLTGAVLNRQSFGEALVRRIAARLGTPAAPAELLADAYCGAIFAEPALLSAFRADLTAIVERDPACVRLLEPFLHFKGFHAIEAHRLANWLWRNGRRDLALYLQSRSSEVFQTDIHPAAPFGEGVFLDHATGLVIGETAAVGRNVSLMQGVTLGGTGKVSGDRHPKVRDGVLIGAGAKILGNIEIGRCSRVAAGSVVLQDVPRNVTVAGVPAKIVGAAGCGEPARDMDQLLSDIAYDSFSYVI
ncbi:serine O-acetyltransferase [Methylocystis bryophila]|uniref:Serine acetyltransferase n=1 Tax=Methylocystis bryophila TaxID=655015 RepID=A0A1W6N0W1_9HYPH|nr:serine O-acetyltransferase [Methylocystis bryophila]